jgi:hypothetical protein
MDDLGSTPAGSDVFASISFEDGVENGPDICEILTSVGVVVA